MLRTGKTSVNKLLRWSWTVFAVLASLFLSAQTYPTQNFTMTDGMPGMSVQCIYKDSRGLLWIGTNAGLCSFDGKSFRIYKSSEGMTASQIWAIAEDDKDNLWFGSYGDGLFKYDGKQFDRITEKNGLFNNYVRVLCYSKNFHCLIAGCQDGISTIRGDSISNFPDQSTSVTSIGAVTGVADAGNFIYITSYGNLSPLRYFPNENRFVSLRNEDQYPSDGFSCFVSSKGDTLLSNYNRGVWVFNKQGIAKNDTLGQVFSITEDKRGDLWLAVWSRENMDLGGGIYKYDGKNYKNYKDALGIADREIWTVFYDSDQDILWIGTVNDGLFKFPFIAISEYPSSYFNLEQNNINSLYLDSKQGLWISGNRELIRMQPDGKFSFLDKKPMLFTYRKYWNDNKQNNFPHMGITQLKVKEASNKQLADIEKNTDLYFNKIIEDSSQNLIFGNELGLFLYNQKIKETNYLGSEGGLENLAVNEDSLIISGWATAIHPDYKTTGQGYDKSIEFNPELYLRLTKEFYPKDVNRLVKQGKQFWYASTATGLWMSEGMHLVHFNETDSTISNSLNDICFDENGHIIFGSNTGEICIATYKNNKLTINYRINSENGLQGNSISWLVPGQSGNLWVGTNRGLSCIDLGELYSNGTYSTNFIDEESGYFGQSSKEALIDSAGNLWIGAGDQLIRVDTKTIFASQISSGQLILRSLEINHLPADSIFRDGLNHWTSVPEGKFDLKHSENNLVFYFDVLNYRNPDDDRFRVILKGFNTTWSAWDRSRKAVFTNLPTGDFTLAIESYNLGNPEKVESLEYQFTIRRPWWGVWYVNAGFFILLMITVVVLTRKISEKEREKKLRKAEIDKKIVQLEMQALQAQMNPHFIFNSINGIQSFVLANKMDEVLDYLSDFSKMVRFSLENATRKMVPLEQKIEFLHSYLRLEKMRFSDNFDYTINTNKIGDSEKVQIPPMLIQPFVENAIRHGFMNLKRKGLLTIDFEKTAPDVLKCTITDNGTGRETAAAPSGFRKEEDRVHSAQITETRIRLFNTPGLPEKYKIVYNDLVENDLPCGLKVELYLPVEA